MLVTLTHQILTTTSERRPGEPPSECRGELAQAVTPAGAEPGFELFVCLECFHRIATCRIKGEEKWKMLNDYPGPVPRDAERTESPTCTDMPSPAPTPAAGKKTRELGTNMVTVQPTPASTPLTARQKAANGPTGKKTRRAAAAR